MPGITNAVPGRAGLAIVATALLLTACSPSSAPAPSAPTSKTPVAAVAASGVDARMASELARAADRGAMCSGREAVAAGLRAEYFAQTGFQGDALLTRMEAPVDEPWPQVGAGVTRPVRSARWRGWVRPPMSGAYAFHTELPGVRIQVANQWMDTGDGSPSGAVKTVDLAAGRYHPISVEMADAPARFATGEAPALRLNWTAPFGARFLVPKAALFPPSDTVNDKPRATATP